MTVNTPVSRRKVSSECLRAMVARVQCLHCGPFILAGAWEQIKNINLLKSMNTPLSLSLARPKRQELSKHFYSWFLLFMCSEPRYQAHFCYMVFEEPSCWPRDGLSLERATLGRWGGGGVSERALSIGPAPYENLQSFHIKIDSFNTFKKVWI